MFLDAFDYKVGSEPSLEMSENTWVSLGLVHPEISGVRLHPTCNQFLGPTLWKILWIYRCQTLLELSFGSEEHPIELAKAGAEPLLEKGWDVSPNSCAKSINDFAISAIFVGSIRCSFTSFQAESRGGHFVCVKTDFKIRFLYL